MQFLTLKLVQGNSLLSLFSLSLSSKYYLCNIVMISIFMLIVLKYVHAFRRCKCNGHANECYLPENQVADHEVCRCQHNTGGVNCETCLPLYNDRPWARATEFNANECQRECFNCFRSYTYQTCSL